MSSMQESPSLTERKRGREGGRKRRRKKGKRKREKTKQPCFRDKIRSRKHPFKRKVSHSNCISDTRSKYTHKEELPKMKTFTF